MMRKPTFDVGRVLYVVTGLWLSVSIIVGLAFLVFWTRH
jgi:uncharacterized membrane protein